MGADWPFPDPPDTAAFTLVRIVSGAASVLLVTHDADDGAWQFLDGEHVEDSDALIVGLGEMLQLDPSLAELAGLPPGWYARRDGPADPWHRSEGEPPS